MLPLEALGNPEADYFEESFAPTEVFIKQDQGFTMRHAHGGIEILYCLSGTGHWDIASRSYLVKPNRLFVVNSFYPHQLTITSSITFARCVVHFLPDRIAGFLKRSDVDLLWPWDPWSLDQPAWHVDLDSEQHDTITRIFVDMRDELEAGLPGCYSMLVVLLARLLIIVKRLYKASSLDVSEKPEGSSDNLAQAMLQYIRRHYRSDIGTETIAKALGISKKHACRVFKAATGQRISSFINSYRIAEAKNLLVNTDMNITEIAFAVGYSSSAYFSYRFRESTGLSPSEYRTKYRIFV